MLPDKDLSTGVSLLLVLLSKATTFSAALHINFVSTQNAENGDPKIQNRDGPGDSGKFGFSVAFPQKPSVRGTPGNSFWGPHLVFLGGSSGGNENGQS